MTLDHLSGGRFMLGLGASGPQVVEGWYGQPYPKPLARTREYVEIIRRIVAARSPSTYDGEHYRLPYDGRHRARQAAEVDGAPAARRHPDLPRRRGTEERRARRPRSPTAGCRCSSRPKMDGFYRECLAEGFAARGDPASADDFEVACHA